MANAIVVGLGIYILAGALFAIVYVMSIRAGLGCRAIIFPGVTALWPLLIRRWPQEEGHDR